MKSSYINKRVINNIVEEPQVEIKFSSVKPLDKAIKPDTLNVLSLFSGCGGMDLGFEGAFSVPAVCVNEKLTPEFIEKKIAKELISLKKTRFKTVFANDILPDARNAWVHHFLKRENDADNFYTESIVDLVKTHLAGTKIFPDSVDVV